MDVDLRCPKCKSSLIKSSSNLECISCHQQYQIEEGIVQLFVPNDWETEKADVTFDMKAFYEETPFPNYDDFDDLGSLILKARNGLFAKLLDDQIPYRSRIIECGCGTGQLSNFLSIASREVVGTDMCMNSLKLANDFKQKNNLRNVNFVQMNLFNPAFEDESFDIVISNGVLHHTSDPKLAFKRISKLAKPGGYILIGLYHTYGRLATDFRRLIFKLTKDRFKFLDVHLNEDISESKKRAWFNDQYKNPHESKHTVSEVLRWFDEENISFVNSIPLPRAFERLSESTKLFEAQSRANYLESLITNWALFFTGHKEGGFFTMIGRKN